MVFISYALQNSLNLHIQFPWKFLIRLFQDQCFFTVGRTLVKFYVVIFITSFGVNSRGAYIGFSGCFIQYNFCCCWVYLLQYYSFFKLVLYLFKSDIAPLLRVLITILYIAMGSRTLTDNDCEGNLLKMLKLFTSQVPMDIEIIDSGYITNTGHYRKNGAHISSFTYLHSFLWLQKLLLPPTHSLTPYTIIITSLVNVLIFSTIYFTLKWVRYFWDLKYVSGF